MSVRITKAERVYEEAESFVLYNTDNLSRFDDKDITYVTTEDVKRRTLKDVKAVWAERATDLDAFIARHQDAKPEDPYGRLIQRKVATLTTIWAMIERTNV